MNKFMVLFSKIKAQFLITTLAISATSTSFAAQIQAQEQPDFKAHEQTKTQAQIQILNQKLEPIAHAELLIGSDRTKETLKSDAQGKIEIPADWKTAQPVTVFAQGYRTATFLNFEPEAATLQLHKEDLRSTIEVRGTTTQFPDIRRDGKVDFAAVFPGITERDFIQLDIGTIIGADFDEIQILTEKVAIPSNITLPEQRENYVLPITLKKPIYRMSFVQPGEYKMMALHGQFPLQRVVDELRAGKSFYEIVNHMTMKGGGQRLININAPLTGQDIAVNQMQFNNSLTVTAPTLPTQTVMLALPLMLDSGRYFPTDVKRINSGETMQLKIPATNLPTSLVSILMPETEAATENPFTVMRRKVADLFNHLLNVMNIQQQGTSQPTPAQPWAESTVATPEQSGLGGVSIAVHNTGVSTPQFLNITPPPLIVDNQIQLTPPAEIAGILPVATFAVLSEVETTVRGDYDVEKIYRVWEVTQLGWTNQLNLPPMITLSPNKKYRWNVFFMGRSTERQINTGEYFLDAITHISRNTIDL